jgi:deoxyribonucleoside regulator
MNTKFDVSLMVKVAQMYYIDGLKQDEIASRLRISRSMTSMILTEAKEVGIVDINIRNPMLNNEDLSNEIKNVFNLADCFVIPTAIQDVNTLRKFVAQRAIDVFNLKVESQSVVGITWGRTCYEFLSSYIPNRDFRDMNVVPLIGGSNQTADYFQLNEMVRIFAEKLNGVPYFIHGPALASSEAEKEFYLNSSSMQTILEKWKSIDIIISGIGTLPNLNVDERPIYIGEHEIYKRFEENKAIGDICARYFNIHGEFIKDIFYERLIGISVEAMKKAKTVIAIAAGTEKSISIVGALYTDTIDILITDEQTAKALLKVAHKLESKKISSYDKNEGYNQRTWI